MAGRRLVATEEAPDFTPPEAVAAPPVPPEPYVAVEKPEDRRVVGEAAPDERITELTAEERAIFSSLLTCGKRSKTVEVLGHQVGIESLNNDDDLRVGLYTKDFLNSDAYPRAVHIGTCAAGIRTIDGRPLYNPLSEDDGPQGAFQAKVDKLLKFYPIVVTEIYREILRLDLEFAELAEKLGKLKG